MNSQIYNEDCISGMEKHMSDESVHCCITSIPFGSLFSYSGKSSDIGNNLDGFELKESYHRMALANIEKIKNAQESPQLELFKKD